MPDWTSAQMAMAQTADDSGIADWEDLQPVVETNAERQGGRRGFVTLVVILLIVAAGAALIASGVVDLDELLSGIMPSPEPQIIVVSEPTDAPAPTEAIATATVSDTEPEATPAATEAPTSEVEAEPSEQATIDDTLDQEGAAPSPEAAAEETLEQASAVPDAEATATAPATEEPSPAPDATASPAEAFISDIASAISEFQIIQESSGVESTAMGNTLVLQLCAIPGTGIQRKG